ncbi:hypothetical protein KSF73_02280 [Burkholderiaceae bacterium DAT-1]|nr:hypothetical protein [Burkholderiaceae bacterium DAT-1]
MKGAKGTNFYPSSNWLAIGWPLKPLSGHFHTQHPNPLWQEGISEENREKLGSNQRIHMPRVLTTTQKTVQDSHLESLYIGDSHTPKNWMSL